MNERKDVAQSQTQDVARQTGGQPQRPREALVPAVDIYENDAGITLTVDLPGVSGERLNIQADRDSLKIEGEAVLETAEGLQALYAEVRNPLYRRAFALSSELDSEAIEANLKDGVLTLRLPKKAIHQPRKIQIQT